jgi:hypothetical protein
MRMGGFSQFEDVCSSIIDKMEAFNPRIMHLA